MNKKINNYIKLKKFNKIIREADLSMGLNIDENILILLSVKSLGFDSNDFIGYKLRLNHYLIESLEIDDLPSHSQICNSVKNIKAELLNRLLSGLNERLYGTNNTDTMRQDMGNFDIVSNLIIESVVKHINRKEKNTLTREQKKSFKRDGYLIIENCLSTQQVDKLAELTLFIAKEENSYKASYRYGDKENRLQRVYNLISKHPIYIELLELDIVREILDYYFERDTLHFKYVLSGFTANILHPGSEKQNIHVDGLGSSVPSLPPYPTRMNINFLLTDWTKENGATSIIPGSHKLNKIPKHNEGESQLIQAIAPKGSILIWGGHVWHRSEKNNSNSPRFGLFACFAASQFKELTTEEEHLSVVDKNIIDSLSPEMKFMIGLDRGIKKGAMHRVDFSKTKCGKIKL